ncbi:MAG: DUF6261 family protein, partial [Bacteroidaceae bacterium]|nr:DUF6261 family protein [Bacteroidaceae bacterium]
NDYDTSNGMFQEAKAAFQRAIKKEEERITTFRSSEWTVVMREAGHRRKYSYKAIVDCIKTWSRIKTTPYYEDAQDLKRYIKLYNIDPYKGKMDELSGLYRIMIEDFTDAENLQKVKNIGAEVFLNELIRANAEFSQAVTERAREKSQVEGTVKEAREETETALKEMIMAINSLYYLTRDEALAEIIKICNVDIKRVKTQILRRKKKLSAEPEMPEIQQTESSAGEAINLSDIAQSDTLSRHTVNGENWPPLIYDPLTGAHSQEEFYEQEENRSSHLEQEGSIRPLDDWIQEREHCV